MKKYSKGDNKFELGAIHPEDSNFKSSTNHWPSTHPPTQSGKIEKSNYEDNTLKLGVILSEEFKFRILDLVKPPVDHDIIPLTENSKNWKKVMRTLTWMLTMNLPHLRKMAKNMIGTPTWTLG